MSKGKKVFLLLLVLILLTGCGKKKKGEESPYPAEYAMNDFTVTALSVTGEYVVPQEETEGDSSAQEDGSAQEEDSKEKKKKEKKKKKKKGEEEEAAASASASASQPGSQSVPEEPLPPPIAFLENLTGEGLDCVGTYVYSGVPNPAELISIYVQWLTEQEKYVSVDDTCTKAEAEIDYTLPQGTVLLAKNTQKEEKSAAFLTISWTPGLCSVMLREQGGGVVIPKPGSSGSDAAEIKSDIEMMDFLGSRRPSDLGLEGETMEDYRIYVTSGNVMVDDKYCVQLNVYSLKDGQNTNEMVGTYFITGDARHVYKLDREAGKVTELDVSQAAPLKEALEGVDLSAAEGVPSDDSAPAAPTE